MPQSVTEVCQPTQAGRSVRPDFVFPRRRRRPLVPPRPPRPATRPDSPARAPRAPRSRPPHERVRRPSNQPAALLPTSRPRGRRPRPLGAPRGPCSAGCRAPRDKTKGRPRGGGRFLRGPRPTDPRAPCPCDRVTRSRPSVSVPVLSRTTSEGLASRSIALEQANKIQVRAACATAEVKASGVAMPSAQGHACDGHWRARATGRARVTRGIQITQDRGRAGEKCPASVKRPAMRLVRPSTAGRSAAQRVAASSSCATEFPLRRSSPPPKGRPYVDRTGEHLSPGPTVPGSDSPLMSEGRASSLSSPDDPVSRRHFAASNECPVTRCKAFQGYRLDLGTTCGERAERRPGSTACTSSAAWA